MIRALALIVFAVLIAAGLALIWPLHVSAQDCLVPLGETISDVEAKGGAFIDLVDVRSDHFDQIVILTMAGGLFVGGVKDGCIVTPPIPLDTVEPVTPA